MTDTTSATPATDPLFIRPREGRVLAGVCAGIADRWHLDVTLVRVGAAVLTLISGVGLLAYAAAWALTPTVDGPAPLDPDSRLARRVAARGPRLVRRGLVALLILLLAGGLIGGLHRLLWWNWGWSDIGFGLPIGLIAVAAALAVVVSSRAGRFITAGLAVVLALLVSAVGVFGSDFGTRSYTVASVHDLQGSYDYAAGTVRLDLRGLGGLTGHHHTVVRVGSGDVTVAAPPGVPVLVRGRAGIGSVTIDGHRTSGLDTAQSARLGGGDPTAPDELVLDVKVGVGSITVT